MKPIKQLALILNVHKPNAEALGKLLQGIAEQHGVATVLSTDYPVKTDLLKGQDACCVIGGDGTLLSTVPESITHQVPVFGINQGKLGFLATFSADEAKIHFEKILMGSYKISKRSVIFCRTADGQEGYALNDTVIKSRNISRLVHLQVYSNHEWVTEYFCDGLIFSTSTGSTAYNLSAGGPIVTPGTGIMTMTPICPHTLTNRSMVFAHDTLLTVDGKGNETLPHFSLDGMHCFDHSDVFPIELTTKRGLLSLLQPEEHSYFQVLRQKLKW